MEIQCISFTVKNRIYSRPPTPQMQNLNVIGEVISELSVRDGWTTRQRQIHQSPVSFEFPDFFH